MKNLPSHISQGNGRESTSRRNGRQESTSNQHDSPIQRTNMTVAETPSNCHRYGVNSRGVTHEGRHRRLKKRMIDQWLISKRSLIQNEYKARTRVATDKTLHIPLDPLEWSTDDVKTWLQNMAVQCGIDKMPYELFQMNGKGLCIMPTDGFSRRVPEKGHLLKQDYYRRLKESRTGLNLKKV